MSNQPNLLSHLPQNTAKAFLVILAIDSIFGKKVALNLVRTATQRLTKLPDAQKVTELASRAVAWIKTEDHYNQELLFPLCLLFRFHLGSKQGLIENINRPTIPKPTLPYDSFQMFFALFMIYVGDSLIG